MAPAAAGTPCCGVTAVSRAGTGSILSCPGLRQIPEVSCLLLFCGGYGQYYVLPHPHAGTAGLSGGQQACLLTVQNPRDHIHRYENSKDKEMQ